MWPNRIDSQTYPARSFISCGSNIDSETNIHTATNPQPHVSTCTRQPPKSLAFSDYMYKTGPQILLPPLIMCTGQLPQSPASPDYMYKTRFPPNPPPVYVYKKAEFPNIQPFLITCIRQTPKLLPCSDCAHKIALPLPLQISNLSLLHMQNTPNLLPPLIMQMR